jgi:hypothetical protein
VLKQQKLERTATSLNNIQHYEAEGDDLVSCIVTGDEMWAHNQSGNENEICDMEAFHIACKEQVSDNCGCGEGDGNKLLGHSQHHSH